MKLLSKLRYAYLAYFSRPSAERCLFRAARRSRARSLVEIGVGAGDRGERLLRFLGEAGPVRYTGIDLFEGRPADRPGMTLKRAHRRFNALAKARLIPGDPHTALAAAANALVGTDLLVIAADQDAESLAEAWFYVPRMLHDGSIVLQEEDGPQGRSYRHLSGEQITALAAASPAHRRRAA